jgi:hypothetical protein
MKNSLSFRGLVAIGLLVTSPGFGKGLDKLAPSSEETAEEGAAGKNEGGEDSHGANGAALGTSSASAPTRAIQLASSYGWAGISKESNSWHGNGMSDLTVSYRLPMKIVGEAMYATFRYAPMAVSPVIKDNGANYAYTGTVEGYHFGANAQFRIKEKLVASGSAELGFMKATLVDALGLPDHEIPAESGVGLTVGGGADWQCLPGFDVGPRLYVGLGSFMTFQLSTSATFSF